MTFTDIYWVRVVMSAYSTSLHCAENKEELVAVSHAEAQVTPVLALTQVSSDTLGKAFNFCLSLQSVE